MVFWTVSRDSLREWSDIVFFQAAAEDTNDRRIAIAAAGKQKQRVPFPQGIFEKNCKNFRKKVWRIEKSCIFAAAKRKQEGH